MKVRVIHGPNQQRVPDSRSRSALPLSELSLQSRMKLYEAIANRMQKKVKSSKFVVSFKDLETPFSLTEDKQILRIYSIKNDILARLV